MSKDIDYSSMNIDKLENIISQRIEQLENESSTDKGQSMKLEPVQEYDDGLELFDDEYYKTERQRQLKELREHRDYYESMRNNRSNGIHM